MAKSEPQRSPRSAKLAKSLFVTLAPVAVKKGIFKKKLLSSVIPGGGEPRYD